MVCDNCKRNLETREFNSRNLCFDCAIKEYPSQDSDLDFLNSESVRYKFSKVQDELDEEEYYSKIAEGIKSEFDKKFKDGDIEGLLYKLRKLINSKFIESEYFDNSFVDYFMNDFQNGIYIFLRNKQILDSGKLDELSSLYVKIYSLMGEPVPGLAHNVRGDVLDTMNKIEDAFEEYLLALKLNLDNFDGDWDTAYEFMDSLECSGERIKRAFSYLKIEARKVPELQRHLDLQDKFIRDDKLKREHKPRLISPDKPYSNLLHIRKTIEECADFIDWFDPYFTKNGFDVLLEAENESIKRIRILSGIKQTNERLRNHFQRFRDELNKKSINVEFRILMGRSIEEIHDRWMISSNKKFNVPSLNTIYRGQWSEIKETSNNFPFEKYWNEGKDLIKDWEEISKVLNRNST